MTSSTSTPDAPPAEDETSPAPQPGSLWAAFAGFAAVGLSLGVTELIGGLLQASKSVIVLIGDWVVDTVPSSISKWAIETFGTYDKVVLLGSIVAVALAFGALVGWRARSEMKTTSLAFIGFGAFAYFTATSDPVAPVGETAIAIVLAVLAGFIALSLLIMFGRRAFMTESMAPYLDDSRRSFMLGSTAVVALGTASAAFGRRLVARISMAAGREEVIFPTPVEVADAVVAGAQAPGAVPVVTPNDEFYRIDTALTVPRVALADWSLKITGMVDKEIEFTYDDLLRLDLVERHVTLSCVSNQVGGGLVGNAKWLGIPISELLDLAGVQNGATQIVARSVDNFEVGFPTEAVYDGREALLAIGMNDEPLPFDHGFPARFVVAGLYGYVSATKWLSEIELTTWEDFDGYWIPRGWAKEGPIKTQSRIDVPSATIDPGETAIAGVAWAPNIGIERVEVRIDRGEWQAAELAEPIGDDSWRQWYMPWEATSGAHTLEVRATDKSGYTQTEDIAPVRPDGATGYHTVRARVN